MAVSFDSVLSSCQLCHALDPSDFPSLLFSGSRLYERYGPDVQIPIVFSEEGSGTWRSVRLRDIPDAVAGRSDAYFSACTYFPRAKYTKNKGVWYESGFGVDFADQLCAFVLDIDRLTIDGLSCLVGEWESGNLPPSYVTFSGHGVHLYYALSKPVDVLKRWRLELAAISRWLYDYYGAGDMWEIDRHGFTQPYRVPGSLPKRDSGAKVVTVYDFGYRYDISDLATIAGLEQTVFTKEAFDMSCSLAHSIHGNDLPATGKARRGQNWGFYNWLFSREMDRSRLYGEFGHRYNQVVCLSVAAKKNHVPFAKLETDVKSLYRSWNECSKKYGHPPIKWSECTKAMKVYNQKGDVEKFPRWWLEEKCGFEFGHQKRNGLTQAEHLANVHRRRRLDSMMRLSEYLTGHPDATKNAACRDLSMSKSTVCRHWRMACAAAGVDDTRSRTA